MYIEEIHFRKLFLKQFKMVLEHLTLVTLTFDPEPAKSIEFLCYPEWMCGLTLRRVGQGDLEFTIIDRKRFWHNLTSVILTFDPVTPRSIGFICNPGWMCGPGIRKVGQGVLELLIGNVFGTFDHGDLDIWFSDPKSIEFLCYLGWMCGLSLRRVVQGDLEFTIIDRKRFWHIWPQWFRPLTQWPQDQ